MKDLLVLKDLEQIKCISSTYRLSILEAFEEKPATAKVISEKLGEPHAKVNYHLKEMLKLGILDLVEEVVKLGIVEKYYLPVARQFIVDSRTMKITDEEVGESINQYRLSIFERISDVFYQSISAKPVSNNLKLNMVYDVYLADNELQAFYNELNELLDKYSSFETQGEQAKRYAIVNMIIPDVGSDK